MFHYGTLSNRCRFRNGNIYRLPHVRLKVWLAKINSALLMEHIAGAHRLNSEIKRSPDATFGLRPREAGCLGTVSDEPFPRTFRVEINKFNRPGLGSQVVTMMQPTESGQRHDLGVTSWLHAWSAMGRIFSQSQMRSVEMVIADIF